MALGEAEDDIKSQQVSDSPEIKIVEDDDDGSWKTGNRYNRFIQKELDSFRKEAWKKQIGRHLDREGMKILDVGTGPGFFACILSEMGHDVTGIDASEGMLGHAARNAQKLGVKPEFVQMDVNELTFADDTFDVIVTRNVTWTLMRPNEVYSDLRRILKPGGKLLIYDANWFMHMFDEELLEKVNKRNADYIEKYGEDDYVRADYPKATITHDEKTRPLADIQRPEWDEKVLKNMGMEVSTEEDIGRNVYEEWEKELYAESPLFEVCAVKTDREERAEKMHTYWQERSKTYIFDPENFKKTQDFVRPFINEGIKRVLDVGTGPGFMAACFADMGLKVTGADLCSEMIAKARANFAAQGLEGDFVVTEADELPFDDDSFDMIVCRNVTWALPDPEKTLRVWKRVLRHGGLLFYEDGNHYNYHFDEEKKRMKEESSAAYEKEHGKQHYPGTPGFNLCDETAKELPMSPLKRPEEWDDIVLPREGFFILKKEISYPYNLRPFGEGLGYAEYFSIVAKNYKK